MNEQLTEPIDSASTEEQTNIYNKKNTKQGFRSQIERWHNIMDPIAHIDGHESNEHWSWLNSNCIINEPAIA
jgi:hypothetical protein